MRYAYEAGLIKVLKGKENPDGLTGRQLAEKFVVNKSTIGRVQRGKYYKNANGAIRTEHGCRKLNSERRAEIRELYQTGEYSQRELAKKFDTTQYAIWKIIHEE